MLTKAIVKRMVQTLQKGEEVDYSLSVIGYWIEGIPYSSTGLSIEPSTTLNAKATDLGFEAELFWAPGFLDPATVQKNGTEYRQRQGAVVEVVKVLVRVYHDDISRVAQYIQGVETMVFEDDRVTDRLVSFMEMAEAFAEERRRTKRLPDEAEFYRRWKAAEDGSATK